MIDPAQTPNRLRIQLTICELPNTRTMPTIRPANHIHAILPNQHITPTAITARPTIGVTIAKMSFVRVLDPDAKGEPASAADDRRESKSATAVLRAAVFFAFCAHDWFFI